MAEVLSKIEMVGENNMLKLFYYSLTNRNFANFAVLQGSLWRTLLQPTFLHFER